MALPTDLSGQAYIDQCAFHGVPIPPDWNDDGWTNKGAAYEANGDFEPFFSDPSIPPKMFTFTSSAPEGICIAFSRDNFFASGRDHIDVICQGRHSSKACFWEHLNALHNPITPLVQFDGGTDLNIRKPTKEGEAARSRDKCSNCHAGENAFILHPGYPLSPMSQGGSLGNIEINPMDWHDPIVPAGWPQNAGPLESDLSGNCMSCHQAPSEGGIGRLPKISDELDQWCEEILSKAINKTMPPRPIFNPPGVPNHSTFETMADELLEVMCQSTPGPQLRLNQETLDFGTVELGFTHEIALEIHNDGDAAMEFSVTLEGAPNPEWSATPTAADVRIEPGEPPERLAYSFSPTNLGEHSMDVRVVVSTLGVDQVVPLTGHGTAPEPIDTVLLLDRSGSMADALGGRDKIHAMRLASNLYAELLRPDVITFPGLPLSLGVGDRLGMVKYNEVNSVHMDIETADPNQRISVLDITDPAILGPNGGTGIGGAMLAAAGLIANAPQQSPTLLPAPGWSPRQVLVVLTDGVENTAPFIDVAADLIRLNHKNLMVFSVGLGHEVNAQKLQQLATRTGGYHQVSDNLGGSSIYDLEKFYFHIFRQAANYGLVFQPAQGEVGSANLLAAGPQEIATRFIDSSTNAATFLVLEDPAFRDLYSIDLVAPDGSTVKAGDELAGSMVTRAQDGTYTIWRAANATGVTTPEFHGLWKLQVTAYPEKAHSELENAVAASNFDYAAAGIDAFSDGMPIGFFAAIRSDMVLRPKVTADEFVQLTELILTASLTERKQPVLGASVSASIDVPEMGGTIIDLFDDGSHGDAIPADGVYSNRFSATRPSGAYEITFTSVANTTDGTPAFREETRFITLSER